MRWVFARALSMETPWISTQTCGSTMELGLSVFILGSCWAEITCGRNKTAHKYSKRDLSQYYFLMVHHGKLKGAVTNPYGKLCGYMSWSSARVFRVKVGLWVTQEVRFEHISAAAVWQEAALVEVHLLSWCLEVQSHWRTERMMCLSCCVCRHAGMSESVQSLTHLAASVPHVLGVVVGRL